MEMRGRLRPFAPRESNSCGGVRFAASKRAALKTVQLSHGTCYVWRQSRESIAGIGEGLKPIAIGNAETVQRSHPPLLRAHNVRAHLLDLANSPTHLPLDNETSQAVCAWELQTAKLSSTFAWGGQNRPNRRPKPAEAGRGRSGLVGDWSELVGTGRNWSGTGQDLAGDWSELVGAGRNWSGAGRGLVGDWSELVGTGRNWSGTGRNWSELVGAGRGPARAGAGRDRAKVGGKRRKWARSTRGRPYGWGIRCAALRNPATVARRIRHAPTVSQKRRGHAQKPEALGTWARNIV